ncbi:MAG: winged helix-turn-helix transcriptional regulator, partial [Candidatus Heimdallarchaeota archaeon]|nr:winged helix-turn-helix transcriptional regulator [Candidatus Heimdallarchaeota archaeon]
MMSITTAKLLNNVSHPIRINILKVLYAAPKSFSEILKLLSLESTGKLSFHLESLRPLIEKDMDGNYILTAQGLSIYSLLGSIESDSIIADIIPALDITPIEETRQKTSFFAQIKQIPFYFHLCELILLGSLYYLFLVIQNYRYLTFVESFSPTLFIILFLLPVFFYVNHLYFCQKTEKSFSYLSLGMLTYTILYPICLLFLEQTHYLLKALLDIPEWSFSYDYVSQSMVYSEWFYYSGDLLEILTLYGKTILFNDFTRNPSAIQALNLPRSIFWLVFCCFFI